MCTLDMELGSKLLDWQVVSAAQVFQTLRKVFSAVEHLTLKYGTDTIIIECTEVVFYWPLSFCSCSKHGNTLLICMRKQMLLMLKCRRRLLDV